MTFTEIVTAVQTRFNLTSSESAARIGFNVNDRYKRVTSSIGVVLPRYETVFATATIGVGTLTFTGTERIFNIHDRTTTPYRILRETTVEQIRARQPSSRPFPREYALLSSTATSVTILMDCIPEDTFVLYADVIADADTLSGVDKPAFAESFHDILVSGAIADEYRKQRETALAKDAEGQYEFRLGQLRLHLAVSASKAIYQGKTKTLPIGQNAPTGGSTSGDGVSGSGLSGRYAKWLGDTSLTSGLLYESGTALFWQDTANANNAQGLTINQLTADDHALTLKSSDVNTGIVSGFTSYGSIVESDDFFTITKRNSLVGGALLTALMENTGASKVFAINAIGGQPDTSKSVSATGLVDIFAIQSDGADNPANIDANGNVLVVAAQVGGARQARWLVDEDGDTWQAGSITGVGGTFSGNVSAVNGTFTGDVAITDDLSCDDITANDGILSGALAVTGTVSGGSFSTAGNIIAGTITCNGLLTAAGGQIAFPASQNASADANTLDDYEEGSWTPTITGTGGGSGQAYTTQIGRYVKIGRLVHVYGDILLSTLGTTTTQAAIGGLPFTIENSVSPSALISFFTGLTASVVYLSGVGNVNSTLIPLYHLLNDGTGMVTTVQGDLSNTTRLIFSMTYRASA